MNREECRTHHFACNCREQEFKGYLIKLEALQKENALLRESLAYGPSRCKVAERDFLLTMWLNVAGEALEKTNGN